MARLGIGKGRQANLEKTAKEIKEGMREVDREEEKE